MLYSTRSHCGTDAVQHAVTVGSSQGSPDRFSLGLVNDFLNDEDETPRQEAGDQAVSSTTKWHKHTIAVFNILKRNVDINDPTKPSNISFDDLADSRASRRTAVGLFFELLQLKTWDFIELEQEEAYSGIKVSIFLNVLRSSDH